MASYKFVDDINPLNQSMTIKVKIIRLWIAPSYTNPTEDGSIEMVFMDEKGQKIQASIKKQLIRKFREIVSEGECYIINNFGVAQNIRKLKVSKHPYKISFFFTTSVTICDKQQAIPLHGFQFVTFEEIKSNCLDENYLIDTFGQVTTAGSIEELEKNGNICKRLTLELGDMCGQRLGCTLWNKYAEEAVKVFDECGNAPVVIIIQFAQIKDWRGEKTISNSLFSTRLIFNGHINEIKLFMKRLFDSKTNVYMTRSSRSQSSITLADEFLQSNEKKTLDEILEVNKTMQCTTVATIVALQLEHGWYYLGCNRCTKKVTEIRGEATESDTGNHNTMFYCEKCNHSVKAESVLPKFKLTVRVIDESGCTSFVMFDREVKSLVGKSAYEFKEDLKDLNEDSYPEELNALVGRTCLFKITISNYNLSQKCQIFTVSKVSDREDLIESYTNSLIGSQEAAFASDTIKSNNEADKDTMSAMGDNELMSDVSALSTLNGNSWEETGAQLSTTKKKVKIENE